MFRKLFATLVIISLAVFGFGQVSPASATSGPCGSNGDGSIATPYLICNTTDFLAIADHPTAHFAIEDDLDFTGVTWTHFSFDGELNGNLHKLTGITMFATGQWDGLFTKLEQHSYVYDLQIIGMTVSDDAWHFGPLAGRLDGRAQDIKITGTINSGASPTIGGVVGVITGNGNLKDIYSAVDVSAASSLFGGITQSMQDVDPATVGGTGIGQIKDCLYVGHVIAAGSAAGIYFYHDDVNGNASTVQSIVDSHNLSDFAGNNLRSGISSDISLEDLEAAKVSTPGFTTYDYGTWLFGDNESIPILAHYPIAPGKPGQISVVPSDHTLTVYFAIGFDGGSRINTIAVEYSRGTGSWHNENVTVVAQGKAVITGLTNGSSYKLRIQTQSDFGNSPWVEAPNEYVPRVNDISALFGTPILNAIPNTAMNSAFAFENAVSLNDGSSLLPYLIQNTSNVTEIHVVLKNPQGRTVADTLVAQASPTATLTFNEEPKILAVSPTGQITMAWISYKTVNSHFTSSTVFSSTSLDGIDWGMPTIAMPEKVIDNTSSFCPSGSECGYEQITVAADKSGDFGISANYPEGTVAQNSRTLVVTTSVDGQNWASPQVVDSGIEVQENEIFGTTAGFAEGWVTIAGSGAKPNTLKYSMITKPGYPRWSSAVSLANGAPSFTYLNFVLRTPTVATLVWATDLPVGTIQLRDYNLKTNRWAGAAKTVTTRTNPIYQMNVVAPGNGDVAIGWPEQDNNLHTTKIFLSIAALGNAIAPPTVVSADSSDVANYGAVFLTESTNGNVAVVWSYMSQDGIGTSVSTMTGKQFNAPIQVPTMSASNFLGQPTLLPNGDILVHTMGTTYFQSNQPDLETVKVYTGAAPELGANLGVTGTAVSGKVLTAVAPNWGSYAPILSQGSQWLRCTSRTTFTLNSPPRTCVPIKGATKATYKLTKADKGKFITYSVIAVGAAGTTIRVAPATTAVG